MELKEFILKSLLDIIQSIEEVRGEAVRDLRLIGNKDNRTVEFDVAVSVEEGATTSGRAGIRVLHFVEGGGNITSENRNSTVTRIKFGVNIDSMTKKEETEQRAQINTYNNSRKTYDNLDSAI